MTVISEKLARRVIVFFDGIPLHLANKGFVARRLNTLAPWFGTCAVPDCEKPEEPAKPEKWAEIVPGDPVVFATHEKVYVRVNFGGPAPPERIYGQVAKMASGRLYIATDEEVYIAEPETYIGMHIERETE